MAWQDVVAIVALLLQLLQMLWNTWEIFQRGKTRNGKNADDLSITSHDG